ncbi:MAG: hypothetical protein LBS36_10260, partial [Oscillospiraceae bacterium]|nr:hypothetical protein [Oscillospiraceae bacterium]
MAEIHSSTIKRILSFIMLLLLLTSCSIGKTEEQPEATSAINNTTDLLVPVPEKEWGLYKFPLLVSLPEKELFLYGVWPKGVVLYTGKQGQFFDWEFYSPRTHHPKIFTGDFDHNGMEDVAITVYWKTGTGLSVEELHFLKPIQADDTLQYSDYAVNEEELEGLLHDK